MEKLGYKVFNSDMTCRGFQFAVGETYKIEGDLVICSNGFHFCKKLVDCFNYYSFDHTNKVAIISYNNEVVDDDKSATDQLTIIKMIEWNEVLEMVNQGVGNTGNSNTGDRNTGNSNTGNRNTGNSNTGTWNTGNSNTGNRNTGNSNTGNSNTSNRNTGNSNTGDRNTGNSNTGDWNTGNSNTGTWNAGDSNTGTWNTGDSNTGDRNTGNSNTGDWNTGNSNTGDWNTCDNETGFFNIDTPTTVNVFGKPCLVNLFQQYSIPDFLYFNIPPNCTKEMYKEAFTQSFLDACSEDRMRIKDCPNFDEDIFFQISGIKISDYA